jgi:hypothetical protein
MLVLVTMMTTKMIGMSCSLGIHGFGTGSSVVAAGFSKRITLGFQKHGQKQQ